MITITDWFVLCLYNWTGNSVLFVVGGYVVVVVVVDVTGAIVVVEGAAEVFTGADVAVGTDIIVVEGGNVD